MYRHDKRFMHAWERHFSVYFPSCEASIELDIK